MSVRDKSPDVLYVIVCGAPAASNVDEFIRLAQAAGWLVRVIATPMGERCQTLVVAVERPRRVEVRPFPSNRRLVTAAMRAGRSKMPMYGLVDVDITTANRLLAGHDPPWSLTAFVVASVARAAAAHPAVHAYRNWRGQLVSHRHVDVGTMVEISTPQGLFAIPHLLRDADIRGVPDLTAELRRVKRDPGPYPLRWTPGLAARFVGRARNGFDTPLIYAGVQGAIGSFRP